VTFVLLLLGHGPLFALSTPTLAQGAIELDMAAMTQERALMLGAMGVYGVTPNLQLSLAMPLHVHALRDGAAPLVRGAAAMPGDSSIEALVGWRWLHLSTGVARRIESTVFAGGGASLADERAKALGAAAFGLIFRWFDAWGGGGFELGGQGAFGSVALGPRLFGRSVDVRLFGEVVGNESGLEAGPSALVLVGDWTLAAGALVPLEGREPTRIAVSIGRYVF
jgi:hypothetical protein